MTAAKTEMTWTMRLTETEETADRRNAFGEPLEVHYLAVLEGDDAVLNVDQLDGRELRGLRYGETYEVTLRRKGADGRRDGKRPVREFAWTEHMFPPEEPSEATGKGDEEEYPYPKPDFLVGIDEAQELLNDAIESLREVD